MQEFEKLGVFYLGKKYDSERKEAGEELVLYDSRDLTTHAVCVGMTGSGKTGLCIAVLEEAAIDGIPAIVIDPKGDLANLLLTFPNLAPADFQAWVEVEAAARRGISVEQLAAEEAARWQQGLAAWGQDGARIRRLREAAEFAVYTPGSRAGRCVSIVSSFAAPASTVRDDADLLGERAASTATSLLGLLGIAADPLQSREHVLLSTLFASAWRQGRDLDLAGLIQQVQKPPFTTVGVLDLEAFYPAKERFELAMAINNVLAAPGFQDWLSGEPLDVGRMLFDATGRPRVAIFSIAHLADAERMFFVSLLLEQTIAWMRSQPGTGSLRAVLYMDEVLGYFPPSAMPPSKPPLLVLMKQARAFGLGVVLATQNPVDLDYKGLANAGTWFIGKLQTARDRERLLDGLEAANGSLDRAAIDKLLDQLGNRVFLLHDVHAPEPFLFTTRWTLSYLRGPMTREELRRLGQGTAAETPSAPVPAASAGTPTPSTRSVAGMNPAPQVDTARAREAGASTPIVLPPDVPQSFLPVRGTAPAGSTLVYVPMLLGRGTVRFTDAKRAVDSLLEVAVLAPIPEAPGSAAWLDGRDLAAGILPEPTAPAGPASFAALPASGAQARSYARWTREFADWLYRNRTLDLWRATVPPLVSKPGETERDFRIRLLDAARAACDERKAALREKYAPKAARVQEELRRAEQAQARESEQAKREQMGAAVSIGATLLGAFLGGGRRSQVGRAATAARGLGRAQKEASDVGRATENVAAVQQRLQELDQAFAAELAAEESGADVQTMPLETVALRPKKADVAVRSVQLAWAPYWAEPRGGRLPAWE